MRVSRMAINMLGLICGIIVAALAIFFVSHYFMKEGFEETYATELSSMRNVVDSMLADTKLRLYQETALLSDSRELELAFIMQDAKVMKEFARRAMLRCKANFSTIVDSEGYVLARGHSDAVGDNIANSEIIKTALQGKKIVDVARLRNNGLSVAAASPIFINGQVVGAMLFGDYFRTNAFADEVKRVTGLEMTVFDGDQRLSTTIQRNGTRAVGTRLENPLIAEAVLEEGGTFQDNTDILGRSYKTVYWPIVDTKGVTYGMWFIGTEVEGIELKITTIALSCLLATITIAIAMSCLGILFLRTVINPLEKKAYFDLLTGITNRAGFERKIRALFDNNRESGALFLLDLDHFKDLNDNFGHPEGDECLRRTGRVLREFFRENDLVARLGGDEFVVYTPTLTATEMIQSKADTLLNKLAVDYPLKDSRNLSVTASIGVAVCLQKNVDFERLYTLADSALYKSKQDGRNRYTIFVCPSDVRDDCRVLVKDSETVRSQRDIEERDFDAHKARENAVE